MSLEAMLAVHKLMVRTSHGCFRVLLVVADHADKTGGNSWASIRTIAAEAQIDPKTVRQCLAKLQSDGLLIAAGQKRAGRGNITVWALAFRVPSFEERRAKAPTAVQAPAEKTAGNGGVTPSMSATAAPEPGPPNGGLTPGNGGFTPPEPSKNLRKGRVPPFAPLAAAADASPKAPPTSKPPPRTPDDRGCRIPVDWQPTPDDRIFARGKGLDPDEVADEFRDYWLALAGAKSRKAGLEGWSRPSRTDADSLPSACCVPVPALLPSAGRPSTAPSRCCCAPRNGTKGRTQGLRSLNGA